MTQEEAEIGLYPILPHEERRLCPSMSLKCGQYNPPNPWHQVYALA